MQLADFAPGAQFTISIWWVLIVKRTLVGISAATLAWFYYRLQEYTLHVTESVCEKKFIKPEVRNVASATPSEGKNRATVIGKGVDLTGLLRGHKRRLGAWGPERGPGRSPGRGSGGRRPPEAEAFLRNHT